MYCNTQWVVIGGLLAKINQLLESPKGMLAKGCERMYRFNVVGYGD